MLSDIVHPCEPDLSLILTSYGEFIPIIQLYVISFCSDPTLASPYA